MSEHFTLEELDCNCCGECDIEDFCLDLLEEVREELDRPLIINSAYRCEEHNNKVGSTGRDHPNGQAFDVRCANAWERGQLVSVGIKVGFNAIGVHESFVHLGYRDELNSPIVWVY